MAAAAVPFGNPFERMSPDKETTPPGPFDRDANGRYLLSFIEWASGMWVHDNWKRLGAAQIWSMVNRDGDGLYYVRRMQKLGFLPAEEIA